MVLSLVVDLVSSQSNQIRRSVHFNIFEHDRFTDNHVHDSLKKYQNGIIIGAVVCLVIVILFLVITYYWEKRHIRSANDDMYNFSIYGSPDTIDDDLDMEFNMDLNDIPIDGNTLMHIIEDEIYNADQYSDQTNTPKNNNKIIINNNNNNINKNINNNI